MKVTLGPHLDLRKLDPTAGDDSIEPHAKPASQASGFPNTPLSGLAKLGSRASVDGRASFKVPPMHPFRPAADVSIMRGYKVTPLYIPPDEASPYGALVPLTREHFYDGFAKNYLFPGRVPLEDSKLTFYEALVTPITVQSPPSIPSPQCKEDAMIDIYDLENSDLRDEN